MKKFFLFCLMALTCTTTFIACGDDDDDPILDGTENIDAQVTKAEMKDNGNQLILTYVMRISTYQATIKWICNFDNDQICTSSTEEWTWPNEQIAKSDEEESKAQGENVKRNGKTVIHDVSDQYAGTEKNVIKEQMEMMLSVYKNDK